MTFFRTCSIVVVGLLVLPTSAQFGIMNRPKKGSSFQELQKRVQQEAAGAVASDDNDPLAGLGNMKELQAMMEKAMQDPETMKAINQMTENLQGVMKDIDPETLQKQMEEAMKLMTSGDIMDSVIDKKDEVLASLEATGMVPAEELAKYKADPKYFEEQMRGAFDQMKGLFSDPTILSKASEAMKGMQDAFSDPLLTELQELLMADTVTELQIEELRLKFLQKPGLLDDNPAMAMFAGLADEIKDTTKFQKGFMEGRKALQEMMAVGGAGGELAGMAGMAGMGEL